VAEQGINSAEQGTKSGLTGKHQGTLAGCGSGRFPAAEPPRTHARDRRSVSLTRQRSTSLNYRDGAGPPHDAGTECEGEYLWRLTTIPRTGPACCSSIRTRFPGRWGKLWSDVKAVAESVDLLPHLRALLEAARRIGIAIFYVPHRRWSEGNYDGWQPRGDASGPRLKWADLRPCHFDDRRGDCGAGQCVSCAPNSRLC